MGHTCTYYRDVARALKRCGSPFFLGQILFDVVIRMCLISKPPPLFNFSLARTLLLHIHDIYIIQFTHKMQAQDCTCTCTYAHKNVAPCEYAPVCVPAQ